MSHIDSDSESSTSTRSSCSSKKEQKNVNTAKKSTGQAFLNRPPTRQSETLKRQSNRFMENFNPETSTREKRKLVRKLVSAAKTTYDEKGIHIVTQIDLCDCYYKDCPGCHFPCPKCGSTKCGSDCRCNRKFMYEQVEFCGCDIIFKNPF